MFDEYALHVESLKAAVNEFETDLLVSASMYTVSRDNADNSYVDKFVLAATEGSVLRTITVLSVVAYDTPSLQRQLSMGASWPEALSGNLTWAEMARKLDLPDQTQTIRLKGLYRLKPLGALSLLCTRLDAYPGAWIGGHSIARNTAIWVSEGQTSGMSITVQ